MATEVTSGMDLPQVLKIGLAVACLLAAPLLARVAIMRFRRRLMKTSQESAAPWSLDDLRKMKDSGQLTDQEYQALRRRLIHGTMGAKATGERPDKSIGDSDR